MEVFGPISHIIVDKYHPGYMLYSITNTLYTTNFTHTRPIRAINPSTARSSQVRLTFEQMSEEELIILERPMGRLISLNLSTNKTVELHAVNATAFTLDLSDNAVDDIILSFENVISWARYTADEIHFVGQPLYKSKTIFMYFDKAWRRLFTIDSHAMLHTVNSRSYVQTREPLQLEEPIVDMTVYSEDYLVFLIETMNKYNLTFLNLTSFESFSISFHKNSMLPENQIRSIAFNKETLYAGGYNIITCYNFMLTTRQLHETECVKGSPNTGKVAQDPSGKLPAQGMQQT